jgi:hypothetical protein
VTTPPPPRPAAITPLGLAALIVSGVCTAWLGVEIVLVLAVLAWRQDRRRGGPWGLVAVAMAASDRVFLALFTAFDGLG